LFLFGRYVEAGFNELFGDTGKWFYLIMYVSALMISLLPTFSRNKDNYQYRSLGASGAVSAVTFAGLMLAPTIGIYMYFIPIPIPGFIFAPLYLIISAYMGKRGRDNINHSAHIWGAIYGLAFVIIACRTIDYPIVQQTIDEIKYYISSKS
jgi:membrane associated rhomboid family serine protease